MLEDVCPLSGAGQNHIFPSPPPLCPTWRRCKSSFCGDACKDLKDITGVNTLSLVWFSPHTDPIQQQHNFPPDSPSTSSGPGASRWAPLFMCFLKLILVFKAMSKLILLRAINLARLLTCSIFKGWLAQWTTNMFLDGMDFLEKFLPQWLHCFGKQGRVASGRWSGASGVTR